MRLRDLAQTVQAIARAQARWDFRLSTAILAHRRGLGMLALLTLPVLVLLAVEASGAPSAHLPALVGGVKAYMPSYATATMFYGSIFVGLIAGLITGVIGAGGGYILTPALMSFGIRGIMAVGTDQFHLFAKAIIGTAIHKKLGNVHVGLAAWFVVGSFGGVTLGGLLNRMIFQYNPALSDVLISSVYVLVLGVLGGYAVYDWRRQCRQPHAEEAGATTAFAATMQRLPLPPFVTFDQDLVPGGRRISIYPLILCGFLVGAVASIMGVGGGFITFPMFVYGLGVSTFTTVGTDILQIIFTTAYSSIFQYAIYGFVFYTVAIGMLLGSLVGVQIGALVTRVITGNQIRVFYALTIIAGFVNRLCALPRRLVELGYLSLDKAATVLIEQIGAIVFFAIVGFFALWILRVFARQILPRHTTGQRWIVQPRKFVLGLVGMLLFVLIFAVGMLNRVGQGTAFTYADNLFNTMAKGSTDFLAETAKKSKKVADQPIDIVLHPPAFARATVLSTQLDHIGAVATVLSDGGVHVTGRLGMLAGAALDDVRLANHHPEPSAYDSDVVLYNWWYLFDALSTQSLRQNNEPVSSFSKAMTMKVLEPAYNFRQVYAQSARQLLRPIALLLLGYVLYTLLYGFAIYNLFEGLGITIAGVARKREC